MLFRSPLGANVYGLGEVVASSGFRRDAGTNGGKGTIQTMWTRGIADPVDENMYVQRQKLIECVSRYLYMTPAHQIWRPPCLPRTSVRRQDEKVAIARRLPLQVCLSTPHTRAQLTSI